MTYWNLEELRKHGYRMSESCENCKKAKIRLGIRSDHVNYCIKHESQINHTFVCEDFKKND